MFKMSSFKDDFKKKLKKEMMDALNEEFSTKSYSLEESLSIIDKNKPLQFMVHGRWQAYSHYEMTFDSTTIWFMERETGGRVPVKLTQIERWRADDASDELKAAIAKLKEMK